MNHLSKSFRRFSALGLWLAGLMIFFVLSWWNLAHFHMEAENRLIDEAGRTAAQIANLFAMAGEIDELSARAIVGGAMEDDHLYAIKVETDQGVMEGQRRNYLWEPIPWDDEIAANCIQGINPIRINGENVGMVDIWLSSRLSGEEEALLFRRELWRFCIAAALWTLGLFFVFWQWGDLGSLKKLFASDGSKKAANEKIQEGRLQDAMDNAASDQENEEDLQAHPVVDPRLGRLFQKSNPDSWMVTAGMFRQTFARGPALLGKLYSEGETGGLCHLGRILEQAAPCIGAEKLVQAARRMQQALNDPTCEMQATAVEECAAALEETLDALCGNGQWRSGRAGARS